MTKKTFTTSLAPRLQNEETQQAIMAAATRRDQVDFECFLALRDLVEGASIYVGSLSKFLTQAFGDCDDEVAEIVAERVEQIEEALQKRRDADVAFSNALRGQL